MSIIKSALEVAMERASGVKIDVKALQTAELEKTGRRLAARALNSQEPVDVATEIELAPQEERPTLLKGVVFAILDNLVLPGKPADMTLFERAAHILTTLNAETGETMNHTRGAFEQFLTQKNELRTALEAKYAPVLRRKEEMMRERTGRSVKLTIETDPEVRAAYTQQSAEFASRYQEVLLRVKWDIAACFKLNPT